MPGLPLPSLPPPAFTAACQRWAAGSASSYDKAVLSSLTTQTPLPLQYDPVSVGFQAQTRLPPVESLHHFHAAKDAARAAFHAQTTRARSAALNEALSAPPPTARTASPRGLGAAPARKGLAAAAAAGLGSRFTATWAVSRAALSAAGPGFVVAAKNAGWYPLSDVEVGGEAVTWQAGDAVSDAELARMVVSLLRAVEKDVIAAGEAGVSDVLREPGARSRGLRAVWLRARVRLGAACRGLAKKRRRTRGKIAF